MAVLGAAAGFWWARARRLASDATGSGAQGHAQQAVYAALELVIGLWGLICVWLLPFAGRAPGAPFPVPEPAPALLWGHELRIADAEVLLPATVCAMGGTLTALERIVRRLAATRSPARASMALTLPSAPSPTEHWCRHFFTDFPHSGFPGRASVMATINVACALGIMAFGSVTAAPRSESRASAARAPEGTD